LIEIFETSYFETLVKQNNLEEMNKYLSKELEFKRISLSDISNLVYLIIEEKKYKILLDLNNSFESCFKMVKFPNGATVLMQSILNKDEEFFNFLIDNFSKEDLRIDFQNKNDEQTALHYAAYLYDKEKVKRLLLKGANPNIKDKHKKTPLEIAKYNKNKSH
jgi:ankyrin repeat protein